MRFVRDSTGETVTLDPRRDKLGAGGEGTVYALGRTLAAKIYKKPETRRDKVLAMLANPPADDSTPDHESIAWPLDVLLEPGPSRRFAGFLMKRVDGAGGFREVAHFRNRRKKRPHFTSYELHVVALNIASAFGALHRKGYVVGDVNDRNILVSELGLATLLDTDSFQVPKPGGAGCFRCPVKTPEFTPPELQQVSPRTRDRSVEHDLFGLGVLLFQLLMQGNHPFNGSDDAGWTISTRIEKGNFPFGRVQRPIRPPQHAPPLSVLAGELGELFVRCFEEGASDPGARPRAAEWRKALDRARLDLATCRANDNHRYPSGAAECPWCRIRRDVILRGGQGLDYFPDAHAQVPLPRPARGKVLGGSRGARPSAGSTAALAWQLPPTPLPRSTPARAAAPAAAPLAAASITGASTSGASPSGGSASVASTSTWGGLALEALGAMASAYLGNRAGGGRAGALATPPADIVPGRWDFRLVTPAPPMTPAPVLLGGELQLAPNGTFGGTGMLVHMFVRSMCHLAGHWAYDPGSRLLRVATLVNGMPVGGTEELRVTGGIGAQLEVAAGDGRRFAFRRLS
jgi:serine/threonine protein kinase